MVPAVYCIIEKCNIFLKTETFQDQRALRRSLLFHILNAFIFIISEKYLLRIASYLSLNYMDWTVSDSRLNLNRSIAPMEILFS